MKKYTKQIKNILFGRKKQNVESSGYINANFAEKEISSITHIHTTFITILLNYASYVFFKVFFL